MGSTTYQFSGAIGASIEGVFALLTDPARFPDWLPGCRSAKGSGPLKKGARFTIDLRTPLRTRAIQIEVIEFIPPTTFGWAEVGRGTKTFFKLQFGGGSTAVTMKHIWAPRGMAAWLRGALFRRRQLEKQFDGALQNFRKILTR
jgi:uncharacterized protein YndB with AHSA1/START domain